jgi:hypothetical protein
VVISSQVERLDKLYLCTECRGISIQIWHGRSRADAGTQRLYSLAVWIIDKPYSPGMNISWRGINPAFGSGYVTVPVHRLSKTSLKQVFSSSGSPLCSWTTIQFQNPDFKFGLQVLKIHDYAKNSMKDINNWATIQRRKSRARNKRCCQKKSILRPSCIGFARFKLNQTIKERPALFLCSKVKNLKYELRVELASL